MEERKQGEGVTSDGTGVFSFHFSRGLELICTSGLLQMFSLSGSSSSLCQLLLFAKLPLTILQSSAPNRFPKKAFSGPPEETKVRFLLNCSTWASLLHWGHLQCCVWDGLIPLSLLDRKLTKAEIMSCSLLNPHNLVVWRVGTQQITVEYLNNFQDASILNQRSPLPKVVYKTLCLML